jgi:hypothetical protein
MNANGNRETQIHAFVLTVFRQVPLAGGNDGTENGATAELYPCHRHLVQDRQIELSRRSFESERGQLQQTKKGEL